MSLHLRPRALQAHDVSIRVGQLFPAAFETCGEALHLLSNPIVQRLLVKRTSEHSECLSHVSQALLVISRDSLIKLQPFSGRHELAELRLVDLNQALPLPTGFVQGAEHSRDICTLLSLGK
jgi:hypothetical protein